MGESSTDLILSRLWSALVVAGIFVAGLLAAGVADASTITVGSPLPTATSEAFTCLSLEGCTGLNTVIPASGAVVQSPVNGLIVGWRIQGASHTSGYAIRVMKPAGGANFAGAGTSASAFPNGASLETFTANLPIEAGDYVGLNVPSGASLYAELVPGAEDLVFAPFLADNSTDEGAPSEHQFAFDATVQPAPAVTSVGPLSGPTTGGTAVTITGTNFIGVGAVNFGGTPATSFTVAGEHQISAVSPPVAAPTVVDVSVTGNAGISAPTGSDHFEYVAPPPPKPAIECVVPKLKGKKLKAAKKGARKADCRVGKITKLAGATTKSGKVVKQKPKPGKSMPAGTKITVTIG